MKIARVEPGSEAEALGLGPGDELLSVDENELNDSLDYDFYTDSKSFHLKARVADGIREWDVQRTERGPFGCDFQTYLGSEALLLQPLHVLLHRPAAPRYAREPLLQGR